ncbi:cytochrome b/b6 domain-containing protein [Kordiimonas aquimaris]|uniref:cytochrome b/b6 domain-containing protein n=1 Tax=Kordiimonas aquimaris TaxID=707591 RepID=UPI0021CE47AD|nr:cytochrome b/b6 domain-containing protein [Kordiimonas aquimaris]
MALTEYKVWDRTTRIFHWINVLAVLVLIACGVALLNAGKMGIPNDGKIILKTVHVYAGYVFAINLAWRLVWAFIGGPFARWRAILPFGKGYMAQLKAYMSGEKTAYRGHNPLGRLAVTALLIAMTTQAVTGLVLAGTDIYYPPFGAMIAEWIAAPGVDPSAILPYDRSLVDPAAYDEMRSFRRDFLDVHVQNFYIIISLIVLHIAAVVWTENKHGGGIVSGMFTGRKVLNSTPEDDES